ncbi:MAG: CDP-alcohol phosphatidyltransferase family protein [Rhizobiales bacterium]|nr:CDP-alcohol phosphatidyltransferase family protein [Hyphomicrobiales bacterium]
MMDRYALRLFKPVIDAAAQKLHAKGCNADQITFTGLGFGLLAALSIAIGQPALAIVPLLLSRACDGVDGALARLHAATDRGAFLDISLDFVFYAAIPLAFAITDPQANGLAAAVLLAAFLGTGTSFLAYAVIAEKRGLKSTAYPSKSIYYLGGLTEGTETIACFLAMCWWPGHFAMIAYIFAGLCVLTSAMRIFAGWRAFAPKKD